MPHDDDPYSLGLGTSSQEDLGEEVEKTNTELEKLKRQLDLIERQKVRLDELRRRQDELDNGREEMINKLTRALAAVEREYEDAQHRLQQLAEIQNSFTQHLRYIESINSKAWGADELPKELSMALSAIDDARADFVKAHAKLGERGGAGGDMGEDFGGDGEFGEPMSFTDGIKNGFAFTLPLQITVVILFILWMIFSTGK